MEIKLTINLSKAEIKAIEHDMKESSTSSIQEYVELRVEQRFDNLREDYENGDL